jgi:Na+-translocating ferredoxin:NAD+ oxidoreductase RnfD subunit
MTAVAIRGTTYPVILPKLRDPRLHLAATIISLQVIGQVGFHFDLSIAQILISLATCAVIEVAIAVRTQHVLMWPASALLTGNGVAFVLRVPGTQHGDWWSTRGWPIYAGTAAFSLLSKHIIKWKGEHIFNPSNIGLVVCFLVLGRTRANPLDFWWGPMSVWLALALGIILLGGFTILSRLKLLRVALCFWASFAVGIGVLAAAGHAMVARWHLGPITGFHFWLVLVTSPEVLVFLFFMITDPKTAPRSPVHRVIYAVALGLLASLMIAPTTSEFAAKVALLGSLAVVCLAIPILRSLPVALDRRLALVAAPLLVAAFAGMAAFSNSRASAASRPLPPGTLPPITIQPSHGVQTQLDRHTANLIAHDLLASVHATTADRLLVHLAPGKGQDPPYAVAQLAGRTYQLQQRANGQWALAAPAQQAAEPQLVSDALHGTTLENLAPSLGLDFQQGSFRSGVTNESKAMMGGGLCWLDYNGDGWQDLFVVNSYASGDPVAASQLFENVDGSFRNVTAQAGAGLAVQGDGCVAADLNGDGHTDLVVTTTSGVDVLWNRGDGTFRQAQLTGQGWYTGAAVADVNGDGRPDLFAAGYSDPNEPVANSLAGFPTNVAGVRDLLFVNQGGEGFREVGVSAGLEAAGFSHGLGAAFVDANGDGRPDLYVANDEDPNQLYVNVPWPGGAAADPAGLGFRFEEDAAQAGVADPYAGMGIATSIDAGTRLGLFVTNSRNEPSAAFAEERNGGFASARRRFDPALGTGFAGWGATWADLSNSGSPDLVVAAGAIPVTSLAGDAETLRVLAPAGGGRFGSALTSLRLNGRGVAAADVANDGRVDVAVNTIGGRLVLLHPNGPSGHWLDVALSRFSPGAIVTVTLPDGRRLSRIVQAGSSYLSSEDQRAHFGLGAATSVRDVTVTFPWGGVRSIGAQRANRIVVAPAPAPHAVTARAASSPQVAGCKPVVERVSTARYWNDTAVQVLRVGGASEPEQARTLYDVSAAVDRAWRETHSPVAISYAAYRLLLWRAAHQGDLTDTFAELSSRLRAQCLSPGFAGTTGTSPAAAGNRIAAAAIAAGRRDGSNEALHYADPSYTPVNAPLVVPQAGSTVRDATFWQPLALAVKSAQGGGSVPAGVQTFADAQWGSVRTFAPRVDVSGATLPDPSSSAYRRAALAAIRATASSPSATVDGSPLGWNELLPSRGLAADIQLELAVNAALNDAAVAVWHGKRVSDAPRPISMIRYLAFNGQLPDAPGFVRRVHGRELVLRQGRWLRGDRWTSTAPTPASPGGVSADAAFAAAASRVLGSLTGDPHAARAARAARDGAAHGTELAADVAAGTRVGDAVARRVLVRLGR